MGNYATEAELKARFANERAVAHLTDDEDTGTADSTVIAEAIAHAESLIDSYLARRYATPIVLTGESNIDALLTGMTLDLACYFLFARPGVEITDRMQRLYDQHVAWLDKVVGGKVDLPGVSPPASPTSRFPLVAFGTASTDEDSNRVFSRETMAGL